MKRNTNILFVSVFNYGVIEMAKNHLKSLWQQGHTNTLSFVVDPESANELEILGYPYKLLLDTNINSCEKDFGTEGFNYMSYLRYHCIAELLEKTPNLDIWYMDIDTVVLKNLTSYYQFAKQSRYNICFQSDINMMCTGCMLIFGSWLTYEFVKTVWTNKSLNHNDQILVNGLLKNNPNVLKINSFPIEVFPCGVIYFSDEFVSVPEYIVSVRDTAQKKMALQSPAFIHANWMIGDEKKTAALKKHGLWLLETY